MLESPEDIAVVVELSREPTLITQLVTALGEPVDSYWNGSHTWFTSFGDVDLEWRLHPISGFQMPEASRPEDLLVLAIEGEVDVNHYWEGLEVFPVDDENTCTIEALNDHVKTTLGIEATVCGPVDHDSIGDEFERTGGKVSIIKLLLEQLTK